jgi:hypothetical protein
MGEYAFFSGLCLSLNILSTKAYPSSFMIILIKLCAFHYYFGGQEEAKVLNTKQGNEDHANGSRTDGSSRRCFTILE